MVWTQGREAGVKDLDINAVIAGVLTGDTVPVARALSLVEDRRSGTDESQRVLLAGLGKIDDRDHAVFGLTGPPGVGKSTLANAMAQGWLAQGLGVGMTAVDPSSQRTGGALRGDRARMDTKPGQTLCIRSLASGDRLGGLAPASRATAAVLRAAYQRTIIETVGVGQSEAAVQTVVDTVVLVLQPGSGDTLQFMKAGILEIPDVLVVHKADLGGIAQKTRADLAATLALGSPSRADDEWEPPIILVSAQTGDGVEELLETLDLHSRHLRDTGLLEARRARARQSWAMELLVRRYGTWGLEQVGGRDAALKIIGECPGTALDAYAELVDLVNGP